MLQKIKPYVLMLTVFIAVMVPLTAMCAGGVDKYIPDAKNVEEGMTLWQIIKAGGEVMVVIALLSMIAVALIIYYFMAIKQEKLLPENFQNKILSLLSSGRIEEAKALSENQDNLISEVVLTALSRRPNDRTVIEEAVQNRGRRSISDIWQKLSYLADIAAISPMVGLLGTVLGMIQAFNVIAFQTGVVKPILLASGISKAMVTTAAGLILAIPSMMFYAYFRGVIQRVTARFENVSTEILDAITIKQR